MNIFAQMCVRESGGGEIKNIDMKSLKSVFMKVPNYCIGYFMPIKNRESSDGCSERERG